MTPTTPQVWATLRFDPTEPSSKKGYTPEHSVSVAIAPDAQWSAGEEIRIFFRPGQLSLLKAGDVILLEWTGKKWKPASTQPDIVINQLQGRAALAAQAPPAAIPQPQTTTPQANAAAPTQTAVAMAKREIMRDLNTIDALFGKCYEKAVERFPEWEECDLRAYATTLFIQISR